MARSRCHNGYVNPRHLSRRDMLAVSAGLPAAARAQTVRCRGRIRRYPAPARPRHCLSGNRSASADAPGDPLDCRWHLCRSRPLRRRHSHPHPSARRPAAALTPPLARRRARALAHSQRSVGAQLRRSRMARPARRAHPALVFPGLRRPRYPRLRRRHGGVVLRLLAGRSGRNLPLARPAQRRLRRSPGPTHARSRHRPNPPRFARPERLPIRARASAASFAPTRAFPPRPFTAATTGITLTAAIAPPPPSSAMPP